MRGNPILLVILFSFCDSASVGGRNELQDYRNDSGRTGKGLFFRGGLLKVLNFFPVGGERECQPAGYHVARAGICINAYDCRQRDGKAAGDCADGLGVCCIFEVSCGGTVQNNLTYFLSPGFPELWTGDQDCSITVEKTHAGIMQLKIDFLHFTIGQPNRSTGECDEDVMELDGGASRFTLCGQNHGQHIYYTLSSKTQAREDGELATSGAVTLRMRMRGPDMPRLWLLRLAQLPLAHAAPHGCLQYHTNDNGTIKTFNYASNGRHLASQEYKVCVRRNAARCSVRYQPCDARAFRVGPPAGEAHLIDTSDMMAAEGMMPTNYTTTVQEDEIEGSGAEPGNDTVDDQPSVISQIWSYLTSWVWGQSRALRSPYAALLQLQDDDQYRYYGYGNFGVGTAGHGRQRCRDRVTIPCENEYFVTGEYYGVGVCDPHHCGGSFCAGRPGADCHVESSVTPFAVSVHFGAPVPKRSPEDNIGMCLKYSQQPCDV